MAGNVFPRGNRLVEKIKFANGEVRKKFDDPLWRLNARKEVKGYVILCHVETKSLN